MYIIDHRTYKIGTYGSFNILSLGPTEYSYECRFNKNVIVSYYAITNFSEQIMREFFSPVSYTLSDGCYYYNKVPKQAIKLNL